MSIYVGVDIGARSFDLVASNGGKTGPVERFSQRPEGHTRAIARLKALKPSLIVMEATGVYYLDLAVALSHADLPVAVINPRSFHYFARMKLKGSKTDGIDAALLAEYGRRIQPPRWTPPGPSALELRDLGRQINRLTAARTQARNRLHALQAKASTLALLIEDEREGITRLEQRIERLRQAALERIHADPALARQWANLCAAKGIGEASAIAILGELCVLPRQLKAKQLSRFAGLDVRLNQSGTSVHRPGRLSKAGNAYLRCALYMPALSAVRHDPRAKAFYLALLARGKKKIQALCAVMRKYLTGLWACLKSHAPFNSTLLFSKLHMNT